MWVSFYLRFFLLMFVVMGTGCVESSFNLESDSRLPTWFEVPAGKSRDDLMVTMDYYIYPSGREVVFKLYDKDKFFRLNKVTGTIQGLHPIKLKNSPSGVPEGRPSYEIITVDGVVDIIEHRKRAPTFYLTDDPAIWKELGVEQK